MDGKGSGGPTSSNQNPEEALQIETLEAQLAVLREDECGAVFDGAPRPGPPPGSRLWGARRAAAPQPRPQGASPGARAPPP